MTESLIVIDEYISIEDTIVNRWKGDKTKSNLATMKNIKEFCSTNDVDYSTLEEVWLD